VKEVATEADVFAMREVVSMIYIDDKVKDYVLSLVAATRDPAAHKLDDLKPLIEYGASPRASIFLALGARAMAFLAGRGYVTPQDVKDIAHDVLRHRVILSYEAEAEEVDADAVIGRILAEVPVP
jgi:MoxR-like ATPase